MEKGIIHKLIKNKLNAIQHLIPYMNIYQNYKYISKAVDRFEEELIGSYDDVMNKLGQVEKKY